MRLPYQIRNFFEFIGKVFYYVPCLWRDRDWDHYYLYAMLLAKLERMRRAHAEDTWHTNAPRYEKQIRTCCTILKRLMADKYAEKMYEEHDAKWGKLESRFEQSEKGYSRWIVWRKNASTDDLRAKEREERKRIYDHEEYLRSQDIKHLFRIIERYHRHWWT